MDCAAADRNRWRKGDGQHRQEPVLDHVSSLSRRPCTAGPARTPLALIEMLIPSARPKRQRQ